MPDFSPVERDGYWFQEVVVRNKYGLHVRPCTKLYETILSPYSNRVELWFGLQNGAEPDYIQICGMLDLMGLGLERGSAVMVKLRYHSRGGETTADVMRKIYDLFAGAFGEDGK